jgi:hypothetical protein
MLRHVSAICVPAGFDFGQRRGIFKKNPNGVARTFPITIRAERRVELTLFTFQGHFGFFFFAEPRNAFSSAIHIQFSNL